MPIDPPHDNSPHDDSLRDNSLHDDLLRRWEEVLPGQTALGEDLLRRYAEPHRHYHTVAHLAAVLEWIDRLAGDQDLFLVRLAAWFHDAVYRIPVGQVTNEEASARLVIRELGRAGLEVEELNQVARLVRLTATHRSGARDPEGELLCDADLAVLASPPEEYAAYVRAVRQEYAAVPQPEFEAGRLAILSQLLTGGELFRTNRGKELNAAARRNVEAECADLAKRVGGPVEGSPA